jgi:hypothetical protein
MVVLALLAVAALSVIVAPTSTAQVLPPLPPLPAPPADGNVAADVLGPASASACDAAATVYGLAGPIASAQLPPELQVLLVEADPYLALVTYACGYLVTPPSGVFCSSDQQLNEQAGLLGVPVGLPGPSKVLYDTAAGLEHAFLRLGTDIGTEASRQLASALGCGVPLPVTPPDAAALPVQPLPTVTEQPPAAVAIASPAIGRRPSVPAVVPRPATPGNVTQLPGSVGQLGALRYPVRAQAALLLALPLLLLAGGIAVEPRLRRGRSRRGRGPSWTDATP